MSPPVTRKRSRARSVVYAVLVHAVVIALLVFSFRWHQAARTPRAAAPPPPVNATVIDDARIKQEVEKIKREEQRKRAEEDARKKQLEDEQRAADDAQRRRIAEEQRLADLKLAEKKRAQQDAERKRVEAEKKRAADEAEKKRIALDAERKRAEQQREAEQQRRSDEEAALKEQLAAEERQRENARAARAMAESERYKILIRQKVERNWVRPPSTGHDLSCIVHVRLQPGGDVAEAHVVRGSGNPVFDRSVENAVYKASPLPLPQDPQLFDYFRELEFTFNPRS